MSTPDKRARLALGLLGLALAIGGCALAGDADVRSDKGDPSQRNGPNKRSDRADLAPSQDDDFPTADFFGRDPDEVAGPALETTVKTDRGSMSIGYRMVGDDAVAEGDWVIGSGPQGTQSATSNGRYWPNGIIPFVIDANLPSSGRVTAAIAHWESTTKLRFVPRTDQTDYIHFRSAGSCSSNIGRAGGRQTINLNTGELPASVAAVGIDRSVTPERVFYFYKDSFATAGSVAKANALSSAFRYLVAPGKPVASLIDVGFDSRGRLFAWYTDGTMSQGNFTDFAALAAAKPYELAPGKTPADIAGLAIDAQDLVYAYYTDGTFSVGTVTDLAATTAPRPYTVAEGKTLADFAHVDFSANGKFVAFYNQTEPGVDGGAPVVRSLESSSGTALQLAAATGATLGKTTFMGHCPTGATIHEIGHAVGLYHEQTRHDRDLHVKIIWENIEPSDVFNFQKHSVAAGSDTGAYDFNSIMHYGPKAFSMNEKDTIVPVRPGDFDGGTYQEQRTALSEGDQAGIARMYPGL